MVARGGRDASAGRHPARRMTSCPTQLQRNRLKPVLRELDGFAGGGGLLGGVDDFDHSDVDVDGSHAFDGLVLADAAGHESYGFGFFLREVLELEGLRLAVA